MIDSLNEKQLKNNQDNEIDNRIRKLFNTIIYIYDKLGKKNLRPEVSFQEKMGFLLNINEGILRRAFKKKDEGYDLKIDFLRLVLRFQEILFKRFIQFEPEKEFFDYNDYFIMFLLLFSGNLNEKNALIVNKEDKGLEVAINVFATRFYRLLHYQGIIKELPSIPREGVVSGIIEEKIDSVFKKFKNSFPNDRKNGHYYLDIMDQKNRIREKELKQVLNQLKQFFHKKLIFIYQGVEEIYNELFHQLKKGGGLHDPEFVKVLRMYLFEEDKSFSIKNRYFIVCE